MRPASPSSPWDDKSLELANSDKDKSVTLGSVSRISRREKMQDVRYQRFKYD